jgi:hypothetical protein
MTYDDMVAVHINQVGMVTGVPWNRRNWRWRWECRGESWNEDTGMRIPQHCVLKGMFARGVWISGFASSECMHASVDSKFCMYVKKNSIFKELSTSIMPD